MIKIESLIEEIKEAKNGNKEAYSKLVSNIYNDLFNFTKSKISNEHDAEDILQDAIFRGYLNIHKLKNEKYFKTWITKIIINQCNKYYKSKPNETELSDDYCSSDDFSNYIHNSMDYESLVEVLNEKEKLIFDLHYKDRLTTKTISRRLNMKENSIKSILSRGREKIRKTRKPSTVFIFILCLFIATAVIAVSLISYIQNLFRVENNGSVNSGVLNAIENLEWFQKTDMDYIDLGDGYMIKLDYLLLDEMSLYLVFDLESEKDLSEYYEFSLFDLKIDNENGDLIFNSTNYDSEQYKRIGGWKNIDNKKYHMKQLVYIYTDSFPDSNVLNINFSTISLHKNTSTKTINTNVNISLEISDKFKNRNSISYTSLENEIKKAIITETGFYAIVELGDIRNLDVSLIDEYGNIYNCYDLRVNSYSNSKLIDYFIIANYNGLNSDSLDLIINGIAFKLNNN